MTAAGTMLKRRATAFTEGRFYKFDFGEAVDAGVHTAAGEPAAEGAARRKEKPQNRIKN